jgi:hypothetical protein
VGGDASHLTIFLVVVSLIFAWQRVLINKSNFDCERLARGAVEAEGNPKRSFGPFLSTVWLAAEAPLGTALAISVATDLVRSTVISIPLDAKTFFVFFQPLTLRMLSKNPCPFQVRRQRKKLRGSRLMVFGIWTSIRPFSSNSSA